MTDSTPVAAPHRSRKIDPLRDIGVAPENMGFGQPPDEADATKAELAA